MSVRIEMLVLALGCSLASATSPSAKTDDGSASVRPGDTALPTTDNVSNDPQKAAEEAAWHAYQNSIVDSLKSSAGPRDWALATLIDVFQNNSESSQSERAALIERATRVAPDDTLVQWIAMRQTLTADSKALRENAPLQALQKLEPDNAAVWNEALAMAMRRNDAAVTDAALERMVASKNFDEHFSDLLKALVDVYKRYPAPDELLQLTSEILPDATGTKIAEEAAPYFFAISITLAVGVPALQTLIDACRVNPATGENAARAHGCATIGRMMAANGTTFVDARVGSNLLRVSHEFTDDDVRLARDEDWVYQQTMALTIYPPTEVSQRELVAGMNDRIETGSELKSYRLALARAGISATPPADWVDKQSPFSAERLRNDEAHLANATPAR